MKKINKKLIKIKYYNEILFDIVTEWSREALLEKWMKEPVLCCQLAGVQPPASALQHSALTSGSDPTPEPSRQQRPAMPIPDEEEEDIYVSFSYYDMVICRQRR